jgi:quinol monooxygenase YgiN
MGDNSPVTALVEYQIREENTSMDAWLAEWDIRARDAFDGEPETVAYAAAVNMEAPDQVLVFERYTRGDASLATHSARAAHKHLIETMGARNMTRRRVFSLLANDVPDYGWWQRSDAGSGDVEGQSLVLVGLRFADEAARGEFLRLSAEHADWCLANEPDTTVYSGGLARADVDRTLDVKADDLVFVMGCASVDAVTRHAEEPRHVALGARLAELGIAPENTFTRTYRTTGRGFLWR